MYLSLLIAAVCGIGTGVIEEFRHKPSLKDAAPRVQRRLAATSVFAFAIFTGIAVAEIAFENLKM